MLSIVIPSRTERFLEKTTRDVLAKAKGELELFVVLDGYELPAEEVVSDPRLTYIHLPKTDYLKKRHAINHVAEIAHGEYLMSLDAHCMMDEGFDEKLKAVHQNNWVQIPRRNRLDPENWCLQPQVDKRPPIDYEYTMFPKKFNPVGLHGFKWDERTLKFWDKPIDEQMHFQGSCWMMRADYFKHLGLMKIDGYSGWGQEAEEISFTTRQDGGNIITNKTTWYAHLHKGAKYGRMYFMSTSSTRSCNAFAYELWVNKNRPLFEAYIEKFWPVPAWPDNWRQQLW